MKKLILLVVCVFLTHTTFAQSKNQALHIIFQNIDTTYFDQQGFRWYEFSMPLLRSYKVNDLFEADTTLKDCNVVKGHKEYLKYLKTNYPGIKKTKMDKKVIGHLDCNCDNYLVLMWMYDDYSMGIISTQTLD